MKLSLISSLLGLTVLVGCGGGGSSPSTDQVQDEIFSLPQAYLYSDNSLMFTIETAQVFSNGQTWSTTSEEPQIAWADSSLGLNRVYFNYFNVNSKCTGDLVVNQVGLNTYEFQINNTKTDDVYYDYWAFTASAADIDYCASIAGTYSVVIKNNHADYQSSSLIRE